MKNSKYNLVPSEVIEKAITDDTAALLVLQELHKDYIGRLSSGNDRPLTLSLNYGVLCHIIEVKKGCIHAALQGQSRGG